VPRLILLTALAVVVAGCSDSVPGGKVVTPTPLTVIGTVATPWSGGDAAAGEAVFTSAGCAACHTFTPDPQAKGTIGPNLDKLPALYASQSGQGGLEEFIYNSIIAPSSRKVPGYLSTVMPQTFGQSLKPKQLADLVAFLARGS
jgi:cytochrome c551/c552